MPQGGIAFEVTVNQRVDVGRPLITRAFPLCLSSLWFQAAIVFLIFWIQGSKLRWVQSTFPKKVPRIGSGRNSLNQSRLRVLSERCLSKPHQSPLHFFRLILAPEALRYWLRQWKVLFIESSSRSRSKVSSAYWESFTSCCPSGV